MIAHMPREMVHPVSLKTAYGLTWMQLSQVLGVAPRTAQAYAERDHISDHTKILCALLHREWQAKGLPYNPRYLQIEEYF